MTATTKIWGLGIGPGDPELITLKALKILQAADVVAYPAPAGGDSLVRKIAAPHMSANQEEIVISTPMVRDRFPAQEVYDRAAEEISKCVEDGKTVAVLCEGDPFFYGSFMYLFARLSETHSVEVVPGVSSLTACTAELGLPLATRNDVISILPGPLPADQLEARISATDIAVIIKVGRHLEKIRGVIDKLGLMAKASYIERATLPDQKICPLGELDGDTAPYFSMIFVQRSGDIVSL